MKRTKISVTLFATTCIALAAFVLPGNLSAAEATSAAFEDQPPWYAILGLGRIDFEGDEELTDGMVTLLGLGYDYSERWTFEAMLNWAPILDRSSSGAASAVSEPDTYSLGASIEGQFHFTRWDRIDPFLSAGVGVVHYGEELANGNQDDFIFRGGGGCIYHFNDVWAARVDFRAMLAGFGESPNANSHLTLAAHWNWGARIGEKIAITSATIDSDADGLTDAEEIDEYGTDPHDADTDDDDLDDYAEVKEVGSDPLKPDTDLDMLTDGEETHKYATDPLAADSDKGGVTDGHEVLEDGTDPLNPGDDLLLFTLHLEFKVNEATIDPHYFSELDKIGKVIKRNPDSKAKIEGHADRRRKSQKLYNLRLSERRAQSVLNYLRDRWKINASRLSSKGYGFERPIAPNDPVNGNLRNRRVDVYIQGADDRTDIEKPEIMDEAPEVEK